MRQTIVAGNWKMNGSLSSVQALLDGVKTATDSAAKVVVFPPFVYLSETAAQLQNSGIGWGAQNVSEHASGAYTGEIAPAMLTDFGCQYTLVGHSERRSLYGETDTQVAAKFAAAQSVDIQPMLCIGESLEQRESGHTEAVVQQQLSTVIEHVGIQALANSVIAYEPVWAIGTGKTATPEQAQTVHEFIRSMIAQSDATIAGSIQILYGGSVKHANAAELFAMPDIDGGLIGGASLKAEEFLGIIQAAN